MRVAGIRIGGVCAGKLWAMLVQIALLSGLMLSAVTGQAASDDYLDTVRPQIAEFVRALPLPDKQVQAAADIVAGLQSTGTSPEATVIPVPGSGRVWIGGSDLLVLHQIGHHVSYGLLAEPMRQFHWTPASCIDLGNLPSAWSEIPQNISQPCDCFADASAYFFVLAYGSYQHTQSQTVDPAAASLWALGDTPAGLEACAKSPVLKQLRALSSIYGPLLVNDPAKAYADFVAACEKQSRQSAGWPMPARTMTEWLLARHLYGGLRGVTLAVAPMAVIGEFTDDGRSRLMACNGQKNLEATVNGQRVAGAKTVDVVQPAKIQTGNALSILQLSAATRLLLGPDAACESMLMDEVILNRGETFVEGLITVRTPICTVLTGGGSVVIRVTRAGETMLGVVAGKTTVGLRGGKEFDVAAGETVTVMGDGQLLGPGRADPLAIAASLPLNSAGNVSGLPAPIEVPDKTQGMPQQTAHTPEPDTTDAALLASTDEWQIHMPNMLREVVLCAGLDASNRPANISTAFPATAKSVNLYIDMDLGNAECQMKIRWRRGEKSLSGRIVRASGKRKMLNALTPKGGSNFLPGQYQVDIEIDDEPAATLKFVVTE